MIDEIPMTWRFTALTPTAVHDALRAYATRVVARAHRKRLNCEWTGHKAEWIESEAIAIAYQIIHFPSLHKAALLPLDGLDPPLVITCTARSPEEALRRHVDEALGSQPG